MSPQVESNAPSPSADDRRPSIGDATTDHHEDRAAIAQVIADIEAGFNTNDVELAVAHYAADASAVNVAGVRVTGADALLDAHRQGFAGALRDQHASYELDDVHFVRPDVAVAYKHAWATSPEGERLELDHAMVAQYVFVKEDGRWWIAARQNTLVPR